MPALPQIHGWEWTFNRVTGKWSLAQTNGSMHAMITRLTGDGSIMHSSMMRSRTPSDASSWYNPTSPTDNTTWMDSPSAPTSVDTAQSWASSYQAELREQYSPMSVYDDEEQRDYFGKPDTAASRLKSKVERRPVGSPLQSKPLSFNRDTRADGDKDPYSFESSYGAHNDDEYAPISWRSKAYAQESGNAYGESADRTDDYEISPGTSTEVTQFREPVWKSSASQHSGRDTPVSTHSKDQPSQYQTSHLSALAQHNERPLSVQYTGSVAQSIESNQRPVSQFIQPSTIPGTQPGMVMQQLPAFQQQIQQPMQQSFQQQQMQPFAQQTQQFQQPQTYGEQAQQPQAYQQQSQQVQQQQVFPQQNQPGQQQAFPQQIQQAQQQQIQQQPQQAIQPTAPQTGLPPGFVLVPMQQMQPGGVQPMQAQPGVAPQQYVVQGPDGQMYQQSAMPTFAAPPVQHKEKSPFVVLDAQSKAELKAVGKSIGHWTSKTTKNAGKWLDGRI